jgi:L-fuculose-phosphate aldolase
LKPNLGIADPRLAKGLENCDLCGNSLFREGYSDFKPEPFAFIPPKLLGKPDGAGTSADDCGCAPASNGAPHASNSDFETIVQRVTDQVMAALQARPA